MTIAPFARQPSLALKLKPMSAAMALGGLLGLAVGCAYLGGTVAKASTQRAQAERFQGVTAAGFTDEALAAATGGVDASAMAIAARFDPYLAGVTDPNSRQAALLEARLERVSTNRLSVALRQSGGPRVMPFNLGGALDASRDLECLTQAVYYEARGEGTDGMRAVAQVVLNRVRHSAFPKTVCGVVFQGAGRRTGCQFSFTCDGSMRGSRNGAAWNRAREIAGKALSGYVYGPVSTATHFHTTAVAPAWRNSLQRVNQVGQHIFYRFGGRSGSGSAFNGPVVRSGDEGALQQASTAAAAVETQGPVPYLTLVAAETSAKLATPTEPTPAPTEAPAA